LTATYYASAGCDAWSGGLPIRIVDGKNPRMIRDGKFFHVNNEYFSMQHESEERKSLPFGRLVFRSGSPSREAGSTEKLASPMMTGEPL
jgi:hypothetical protein